MRPNRKDLRKKAFNSKTEELDRNKTKLSSLFSNNFLYKMTTAKSCYFTQDKNIDINKKTAKGKRLEFSRYFGQTT